MSSEELASRAEAGSSDCFAELFARHSESLLAFLLQRVGNRQDAEDLLQDTFIRAHEKLHLFDDSYSFKTWLFTIAARIAYSHKRKNIDAPTEFVETVDERNPASDLVAREEVDNVWDLARKSLPALQATALWLRYGDGCTIKETARRMNKSQVYVKVLLHRGRAALLTATKESLS